MDNGSNNGYYRLKDLVNIKWIMPPTPIFKECGIKYITSKNIKNSTIDFYNCKFISLDDYEKINKNWKIKTNDLLLSMIGTIGEIAIVDYKYGKFTGQNFVVIIPKKIITKYLFYLFHKNKTKKFLIDNSIGSTQKYLSLPILKSIPIYSPPLPTQQKIIDIIEPHQDLYLKFSNCIRIDTYENSKYDMQILIDIIEPIEKIENILFNQKNQIINLFEFYANYKTFNTKTKLINYVEFVKGQTLKSVEFIDKGTPFIDIKLLTQNKITKYVSKKPNIKKGDILISFDAVIGKISWFIDGFNGYAYKVSSKILTNLEILINLMNKINQRIMQSYCSETTIKHSSKSKSYLYYFKFMYPKDVYILNNFYIYSILIDNLLQKILILKKMIIKLLVK